MVEERMLKRSGYVLPWLGHVLPWLALFISSFAVTNAQVVLPALNYTLPTNNQQDLALHFKNLVIGARVENFTVTGVGNISLSLSTSSGASQLVIRGFHKNNPYRVSFNNKLVAIVQLGGQRLIPIVVGISRANNSQKAIIDFERYLATDEEQYFSVMRINSTSIDRVTLMFTHNLGRSQLVLENFVDDEAYTIDYDGKPVTKLHFGQSNMFKVIPLVDTRDVEITNRLAIIYFRNLLVNVNSNDFTIELVNTSNVGTGYKLLSFTELNGTTRLTVNGLVYGAEYAIKFNTKLLMRWKMRPLPPATFTYVQPNSEPDITLHWIHHDESINYFETIGINCLNCEPPVAGRIVSGRRPTSYNWKNINLLDVAGGHYFEVYSVSHNLQSEKKRLLVDIVPRFVINASLEVISNQGVEDVVLISWIHQPPRTRNYKGVHISNDDVYRLTDDANQYFKPYIGVPLNISEPMGVEYRMLGNLTTHATVRNYNVSMLYWENLRPGQQYRFTFTTIRESIESRERITLLAKLNPQAPIDVTVNRISREEPGKARIAWNPLSLEETILRKVLVRCNSCGNRRVVTLELKDEVRPTFLIWPGLRTGVYHSFGVWSVSYSLPSAITNVTVQLYPSVPKNLKVHSLSPDEEETLEISWDALDTLDNSFESLILNCTTCVANGTMASVDNSTTSYTFDGLKPGTVHSVTVYTEINGLSSVVNTASGALHPLPPLDVRTKARFNVLIIVWKNWPPSENAYDYIRIDCVTCTGSRNSREVKGILLESFNWLGLKAGVNHIFKVYTVSNNIASRKQEVRGYIARPTYIIPPAATLMPDEIEPPWLILLFIIIFLLLVGALLVIYLHKRNVLRRRRIIPIATTPIDAHIMSVRLSTKSLDVVEPQTAVHLLGGRPVTGLGSEYDVLKNMKKLRSAGVGDDIVLSGIRMSGTATIPLEQATLPAEQATLPAEQATLPAEQATISADQTILPADQTILPADPTMLTVYQTTFPADQTTYSSYQTILSGDQMILPAEQTMLAADQALLQTAAKKVGEQSKQRSQQSKQQLKRQRVKRENKASKSNRRLKY